ncbi:MAG: hypothetical protein JWP45_498 [Mucilaginibacter sp.]|nr:hypothetical protein [Mucilaginibacter sp.]
MSFRTRHEEKPYSGGMESICMSYKISSWVEMTLEIVINVK